MSPTRIPEPPARGTGDTALDRLRRAHERHPSAVVNAVLLLSSLAVIPFHPVSVALGLRLLFTEGATVPDPMGPPAVHFTDAATRLLLMQQLTVCLLLAHLKLGIFWPAWGGLARFARYHFTSQLPYLVLVPMAVLPSLTFDGVNKSLAVLYLVVVGGCAWGLSTVVTVTGIVRGLRSRLSQPDHHGCDHPTTASSATDHPPGPG